MGKPPDTIDYPGYLQSMDFYHSCDTIYAAGTSDQKIAPYFIDAESWFILGNFDSTLQTRWIKFYGGDSYYNLTFLLATNDAGCVMLGTTYDSEIQINERDVIIIKVDSAGVITGTSNSLNFSAEDVIIYPNPFNNCFTINSGLAGFTISLFNILGNQVFTTYIPFQTTTIDAGELKSGIYFYQATRENKVVGTGKLLKFNTGI
jgi:hypothetical protein